MLEISMYFFCLCFLVFIAWCFFSVRNSIIRYYDRKDEEENV